MLALLLAASSTCPLISGVPFANCSTPFAGDTRLLTTVSPNRDGFRDRAVVSFRLSKAATVTMEAVRNEQTDAARDVVWRTRVHLDPGAQRLAWRPRQATQPRTYVLRLVAIDARGRRLVLDNTPLAYRAPVVRIQGIDAGFTQRSYAP